jgi:predicted metalloprotease with PDZ domain
MKKVLGCLFVLLSIASSASATIHYRISLKNPDEHLFRVRMTFQNAAPGTAVAIPAWNALYQVRDFSYRVRDVRAFISGPHGEDGKQLWLTKLDKQTWKISAPAAEGAGAAQDWVGDVNLTYAIQWNDPGPFNSQLNEHHAFVNFAEILMYIQDRRGEPVEVTFDDVPAAWQLAAQLPSGADPNSFTAASYDALVDAPTEIGQFDQIRWEAGGAKYRVVLDAKDARKDRLTDYFKKITASETKMMGGAPFEEYTFFIHVGPYPEVGGGGMEHANCTAISGSGVDSVGFIAAHEFFHAWNVKRIRPQSLEPVDFTKEMYTPALWFAEGVTSTYSAYTLERTGLWTREQFYADLAGQISELQSRPAHAWQSVEESSLDAWLEKYDDYRMPERSISYYNKGQIIGEMLDLEIRDASDNKKSLDDVMRTMNERFAKQGKFYDDSQGIENVVGEVAGQSLHDFFVDYVRATREIPYDSFLNAAGLALKTEMRESADLGFWTVGRGPGAPVTVSQVEPGSAAQAGGLKAGDILAAVNGEALPRYFPAWLREQKPGERIILRVHRNDKDLEIAFDLGSVQENRYSIVEVSGATERQKRLREGWLAGKTD